jgi:16S rRNA (adenine1518-N6/adenine1519-N6)-dimethyltransferase
MLRSSLRNLGGEALCARADIDPDRRAETVPISGFLALAAALTDGAELVRAKAGTTSGR